MPASVLAPTTFRYLTVATLIRSADSGCSVALVTLAIASAGNHGVTSAAMLIALLTAPNLLGPVVARPLARAKDPRRVLATAFVSFGFALTLCAALLAHHQLVLAATAACLAGCSGPLITGGLSAQAAGGSPHADAGPARRAEACDAATYGVSATLGPTLVAAAVTAFSPLVAVAALGAASLLAAGLTLGLPGRPAPDQIADDRAATMPLGTALSGILHIGPLRRVLVATTMAALGAGGLLVIAVVFGARLGGHPRDGALMAAAYGIGSLGGSILLIARPLRREPETSTLAFLAATAALTAICASAPGIAVAGALFALTGAASAAQFTASLAVRSVYAPDHLRAYVFVTMAGIKTAFAAAGAALAGPLLASGPRTALIVAAVFMFTGAACAGMLRRTGIRPVTGGVGVAATNRLHG